MTLLVFSEQGAAQLAQPVVGAVFERPEEGVLVVDGERDDPGAVLERAVEAVADGAVGGAGKPGDMFTTNRNAGEHERCGRHVAPRFRSGHGLSLRSMDCQAGSAAAVERIWAELPNAVRKCGE